MGTLVLDECLQNLVYAQETMKEWIPMTDYEVLFEAAEKKETADKVVANEQVAEKSVGFVRKAIDAVINLIKKLYYAVKDLIDRCTMSGDERDAFDAFRQAMKDDPSLKNKKVTVRDFREINKKYDELLKEVEDNIRIVKKDESHPLDALVAKVTDTLKGAATSASVIIAADAAIKIADSNVNAAKMLKNLLKSDIGVMDGLSKALGKRGANAFKKDIDAAAKNTLLHRLKVKIYRHKYDDLMSAIRGTINSLTHAGFQDVKDLKAVKKMIKTNKDIDKATKKERLDEVNDLIHKAKAERNSSIKIDARFLKNDDLKPIIKTVTKAAIDAKLDMTKDEISTKVNKFLLDHVTDRDHAKRDKEGIYKSALAFFVGSKK